MCYLATRWHWLFSGLNIARYNVGGSAWKSAGGFSMEVSPNIPRWKQIEGFWLDWNSSDPNSASFNWTADANQRAMLLKATKRGAVAELFSNSPMWYRRKEAFLPFCNATVIYTYFHYRWQCKNHNPSGSPNGQCFQFVLYVHLRHGVQICVRNNWQSARLE